MSNTASSPSATSSAARRLRLWPFLVLAGVAAFFALCVALWRTDELRPYLATLGAAVAAFAGPLPGLLTPELRGKWLFAVAIASLMTGGVWFGAKSLEDELHRARLERAELAARLDGLSATVGGVLRGQSAETRDAFLLEAGRQMRSLYGERRYWTILDQARTLIGVDPENGHGLYYAGEAYRHFHRGGGPGAARARGEMRDMFMKYLDAAARRPEALGGDRQACYARADGYCLERLAWTNHLMALDYLDESQGLSGDAKAEALRRAAGYGRADLELRPQGFAGDAPFLSSCDVLRAAARGLAALGRESASVHAAIGAHPEACGAA